MKKNLLFTLIVIFSLQAYTQIKVGKISGHVKDSSDQAVEAATVLLLKYKDSAIVKTDITNKQGQFSFNKISNGKYIIAVLAISFEKYTGSIVDIDTLNSIINLSVINLTAAPKNLTAVSVKAQKPFIERKIDKLVINVAASPMSAGQSAYDVLEKSPGVTFDENDNISINGKAGVMIYVDNKLSYLSGRDLTTYLKALPASQLDQLEIMTQPPARYDAAGNSGIINFKTKKNQNNGFNASLSTSIIFSYYLKTRNSIVFNWKKNKFNISTSYGITENKIYIDQTLFRAFRKDAATPFSRYLDLAARNTRELFLQNVKLTADYQASKTTSIGIVFNGNFNRSPQFAEGRINIIDSLQQLVGYTNYITDTKLPVNNPGFNINLSKKFQKNRELTMDADHVAYRNRSTQSANNYMYDANSVLLTAELLKNTSPLNVDIYSYKSDYSQPLAKNAKLEAGIKSSYVKTDIDGQYSFFDNLQGKWLPDSTRINHFIFKENINAAYINLNRQFSKKFSMQFGLRAEQTNNNGDELIHNSHFDNHYIQLFPTFFASYAANDKNTFTLTYGRRIDRPSYQLINPFKYVVDQFSYREGNPYLKPVFANNIELSWNYKSILNVTLNYTRLANGLSLTFRNEKSGDNYITYQRPANIASRRNIGLVINYHKKLTKWWATNATTVIVNNRISDYLDGEHITPHLIVFIGNISNQFTLKKGWTFDLSGFYRGKRLEGFPIFIIPNGAFSVGASKKMNTKATITGNFNDPFWLLRGGISSNTSTFVYDGHNRNENRYFTLTFSYRFGKTLQQHSRRNSGSPDEQNRL